MMVRFIARTLGAAAIACCLALFAGAQAHAATSAAVRGGVALATQLLELKGGIGAFDPAIDGVHHASQRNILLQINPNLEQGHGRDGRQADAGGGMRRAARKCAAKSRADMRARSPSRTSRI